MTDTSGPHPTAGSRDPAWRPASRLTLLMSTHDHVRHASLRMEVLRRAVNDGMAGATVFEGLAGFGLSGAVHRTHLVRADPPVAVVIIDEPDRVARLLEGIAPLLSGVLVVLDDVEILAT